MARLGTCNPSAVEQFGQRRDSNEANVRQTGQANARTDLMVAGVTTYVSLLTRALPNIHVPAPSPDRGCRPDQLGWRSGRPAAR
jgi:hypothetical protein